MRQTVPLRFMVERHVSLVVGCYMLLHELGRGAMGVFGLARDELLHREVAVKQLLVPAGSDGEAADEARARRCRRRASRAGASAPPETAR